MLVKLEKGLLCKIPEQRVSKSFEGHQRQGLYHYIQVLRWWSYHPFWDLYLKEFNEVLQDWSTVRLKPFREKHIKHGFIAPNS